jgi:hypothetical protein
MFSWICPQCGSEVPPSYSDCPNCKPVAAAPPSPVVMPPSPVAAPPPQAPRLGTAPPRATAPTPTAPPVYAAPPPPPQPLQAAPVAVAPPSAPEVQYVYVQKPALPAWLVTIGVFVGLCAAGYAFYTLVLNKNGGASASATSSTTAEEPPAAAAKGPRGRKDFTKYLEVAGIRILEENRKPTIRLMLVNHSAAELASLSGTISLSTDGKTDIATIPFNVATLGGYEAKDISAPLKTNLRAYELPDWQFIKAQIKLTNAE